jgi:predicted ribosomally synthesized peptide with SipW-like signal peptide
VTRSRLIALAVLLLALAAGGGVTLAAFTATATNSGNTFSAGAALTGMRVATGTYTGNGVDNRNFAGITTFQPEVVIIKAATAQTAVLRTASFPGDLTKDMTGATMVAGNMIQALTATGFQVGNDARVNQNTVRYDWIAFRSQPQQMAYNTYNGNGAASQAIGGLGFSPNYVLVIGAASAVVQRSSSMSTTFRFDETAAAANGITSLDSNGFTVGNSAETNTNGQQYAYIAFNELGGLVHEDSYTGNGVDNRGITGATFQPAYVLVKSGTTGNVCDRAVQRPASIAGDNTLYFSNVANFANGIQALQADGFQVGTNCRVNSNGATYNWVAFKAN